MKLRLSIALLATLLSGCAMSSDIAKLEESFLNNEAKLAALAAENLELRNAADAADRQLRAEVMQAVNTEMSDKIRSAVTEAKNSGASLETVQTMIDGQLNAATQLLQNRIEEVNNQASAAARTLELETARQRQEIAEETATEFAEVRRQVDERGREALNAAGSITGAVAEAAAVKALGSQAVGSWIRETLSNVGDAFFQRKEGELRAMIEERTVAAAETIPTAVEEYNESHPESPINVPEGLMVAIATLLSTYLGRELGHRKTMVVRDQKYVKGSPSYADPNAAS